MYIYIWGGDSGPYCTIAGPGQPTTPSKTEANAEVLRRILCRQRCCCAVTFTTRIYGICFAPFFFPHNTLDAPPCSTAVALLLLLSKRAHLLTYLPVTSVYLCQQQPVSSQNSEGALRLLHRTPSKNLNLETSRDCSQVRLLHHLLWST